MKTYSILTGRDRYDSKTTIVECDEKDINVVASAIYRGARNEYNKPIACVVKEGEGVDYNDFDIMIADCM